MGSKEKKMTENYKAVLKSSLVMLVLFAVAGSGVARAQDVFQAYAIARPTKVRAEGKTEMMGRHPIGVQVVQLVATGQQPLDATIPDTPYISMYG